MFAMINITDADINYAEKILLREGQCFDAERVLFIKNLETIDLQAVPGSGKTTALLAKLVILERYLPLENNSGVLIISHTNAAVDEIRNRIRMFCPKLFSYPNFVGTIQSFVNKYLAIPFYINFFKVKPYRIDNEIYKKQVEEFYKNTNNFKLKAYLDRQRDGLNFLKSIRITSKGKLKNYIDGKPENFKLKDSTKPTYKALLNFKKTLIRQGYLHFDDSYTLAQIQLKKTPHNKILLQKRFKYVFVDEMQDMERHQHELLEKIFYDEGNSIAFLQRIGDKNQAIFNSSAKREEIWNNRKNTLYLNGSHRLNSKIAPIVEKLALTPNEIVGRYKNQDNSEIAIKPHIIVFDNTTIQDVIPRFSEIIIELQEKGRIPVQANNCFKAIAWIKEHEKADKIALSDYWKEYSVVGYKKQIDFKALKDYLQFLDKEEKTLKFVRKNILNALLKVMRLENVFVENSRLYSKRKLLRFLKENFIKEYENLKLNIYNWSIAIIKGKSDDTFVLVKEYIPIFLHFFDKVISGSDAFINNESEIKIEGVMNVEQTNIYKSGNTEIEIGTIHSAKGQSHTATLYLETFYQGKYESEYLKEIFLGVETKKNGVYKQQALKMSYVGFSRPSHLLCVAIHKDRFDSNLSEINKEIWEIIRV